MPQSVHLMYDGKPMKLEPAAEEVAGFYAGMLGREYTEKDMFNKNFWACWTEKMTKAERTEIKDLKKCDFTKFKSHMDSEREAKKALPKEQKDARKAAEAELKKMYGTATIDGHKEKVGNFRVEPPGLFQGRGEHPKMGLLKARLRPEDVTINVSDPANAPKPPEGHAWKQVQSDNKVTWLATWTENINGQNKYVMLAADSHLKGRKDWEKYEVARELKTKIDEIRTKYTESMKAELMVERMHGTALYFIDKLALDVGGEKDTEEEADTVGCCNLRFEHVSLDPVCHK